MFSSPDSSALRFPEWLFEQDYLVFLSFFGWTLLGLLAWVKPLCDRQKGESLWIWFGYFAFCEAMADFIRTLSFSDPFFRTFSIEVPFEMLGLGCLIEASLRRSDRFRGKSFPPVVAGACGLLGFAIEAGSVLYSLIVAFLVSMVACLWFASMIRKIAKEKKRPELLVVYAGILLLVPAWALHPDHIAFVRNETLVTFTEFPFYGFLLLFLRIISAWLILGGFWVYRLQARIDDVGDHAQERLRLWGYRVLPGTLAAIILASYLVTTWNGHRESDRMRSGFISRSETAALSIDSSVLGDGSIEPSSSQSRALTPSYQTQLARIREIGESVEKVYLWQSSGDQFRLLFEESSLSALAVIGEVSESLASMTEYGRGESFVLGPIKVGSQLRLNVSSPLLDAENDRIAGWLGLDLEAGDWMKNISLARLQTIIIAGLVLAQVVFFLYYQIENESETDLALAKERAEAADRAKSEFLAVISHEIRTPLQSVLGYSNLLRATRLDEKQMACLDTIQSEGKILLRIVQDILDFSNLRKVSSALKEDRVYLKGLIEETYRTIRPMAEKKGLVAELEVDQRIPSIILADGVRLRQILLNLFGNSVKYTEEGSIRLAIRNRGSETDSGALDFIISDSGVGIKREDLERLFEPFIQLEHVGKSPREGAGLGLAIVKRIVELMGGSISVSSEFGKGTVFTVSFSFSVMEDVEAEEVNSVEFSDLVTKDRVPLGKQYPLKTLVADDNPMVRRLIVQYLESLGYEPDEVDDGTPMAEKGAAYDLIVTDLRMPHMDGPTAASLVRDKSGLDDQPWIVGVSATLAEAEIERAMNSGINDFLGKPFFEEDLEKRIRSIPWLESLSDDDEGEEEAENSIAEKENSIEVKRSEEVSGTSFASQGMGFFSDEIIVEAIQEVHVLCERMSEAMGESDFEFIREKAHYISNTAMAVGIEKLYIDSKALQNAAESEVNDCIRILETLERNLVEWEQSRLS